MKSCIKILPESFAYRHLPVSLDFYAAFQAVRLDSLLQLDPYYLLIDGKAGDNYLKVSKEE